MTIEPFTIAVPEADIADLKERLARARWPGEVTDSNWQYGTDLAYLQELCAYWRDTIRLAQTGDIPQPVAPLQN